jgi:transposase-like protein
MKTVSVQPRTITTAQRALIIQRVIVDGWTIDQAAATFGVPERVVAAWVADYRRYGMASLRDAPSRMVGAEFVQVTISRPVKAAFRKIWHGVRKVFVIDTTARPVPLRRSNKDGPG